MGRLTATWNLRAPPLPAPPTASGAEDSERPREITGAFVPAGSYEATLTVGDASSVETRSPFARIPGRTPRRQRFKRGTRDSIPLPPCIARR